MRPFRLRPRGRRVYTRTMQSLRLSALALCTVVPVTALSQYTVKTLVFRGTTPYTQQQLEATSGLKPGDHIGTNEMGEAAQRLMDTGAFADLDTTVEGPVAGIQVIFNVKAAPPATLLPLSFENIVWLTTEERDAGLKQRLPLYAGRLSETGTMAAGVQAALQAMLDAKNANATVEVVERPSSATRATPQFIAHVTTPRVVLGSVRLGGVSTALAPDENKQIRALLTYPYNEGLDHPLADTLLQAYRDAGYLDARLDNLQRTPGDPAGGEVKVLVTAQVVGGEPYHVSSMAWGGSPIFSTDEFAKASKLHAGDVASQSALRLSYQPLLDAYLKLGYLDASIDTQPILDSANHTAAYTLRVVPGQIYRVNTITVRGLAGRAKQDFDSAWLLKPGAVYDPVYASHFLRLNTALRSLEPYTAAIEAKENATNGTVDVLLNFFANNPGK